MIRSFISRLAESVPAAICAAAILGAGLAADPVRAQEEIAPPKHAAVDANGVDLVSGGLMLNQIVNSIGGEGAAGLSASNLVRDSWSNASVDAYVQIYRSADGADVLTQVVVGGINEGFRNAPDQGATRVDDARGSVGGDVDAQEIWYTSPTGLKARFNLVSLGSRQTKVRGYLKSVTYASGEKLTFTQGSYHLGTVSVESSLGYRLSGSYIASRFDATTANLARLSCSGSPCENPSQLSQGRSLTTTLTANSVTQDTLVVTDPTGRTRTYVIDHTKHRVLSYSDGVSTWTYAYSEAIDDLGATPYDGILTVTATEPPATPTDTHSHVRVVKSRMNSQHIISDTDSEGRVTTYQYAQDSYLPGVGRLKQISLPGGDRYAYEYDSFLNVTAKWHIPKGAPVDAAPNTIAGATVVRAAYSCHAALCTKPDWVIDERGNQTDYTYASEHGGVLTATRPAGANGVRPQSRYTYGQFTAMYVQGGVMQAAAAPVWRLTQTSTCMTGAAPACIGTADEVVTAYAYEPSNQPNNVRLLSKTVRSGNGALSATTSYAYNDRGDVVATDGPLPGADDTTRADYDASRWPVAEVTPDPDGAGPLKARATKTTYRADGQVSLVEHGQVSTPTDIGLTTFGPQQGVQTYYDDQARPRMVVNVGFGETNNISQTSYDQLGRVQCQTVRMNPAVFSSLPLSACDLSTTGAYGQDRVTYNEYDSIGRLTKVTSDYRGAPRVEKEVKLYTPNSQEAMVADGNGNLTTYTYDALDRLAIVNYPNVAGGGSSASDYEQYGYDAAGNRITWRRRDGKTIAFGYDALNRVVLKDLPDAWPDITYGYDNLDRQIAVGPTGASQINIATMSYDALGCLAVQVSPGAPNSNYGVWATCDQAGRRTSMTYPNGATLTYTYDTLGELTGIWEGAGTSVNLVTYAYDDLGRRTVLHNANGTEQRYGYDGTSRLKTLVHDLAGTTQDQTWSYAYNPASQVTARTSANPGLYDWGGTQSSRTYGVNGLNQLTNSVGSATEAYGYDARGNLTSSGAKTYTYDIENRLVSTSDGQLYYDPLGRLSAIIPVSGAPVYFCYDGSDVVAEYGGIGLLLRRYVNGPSTDDPIVTYEGADLTQKRWLMSDAQGSIVSTSNAAGVAQAPSTYDEYGIGSGNPGRFGYTGQMWMPELDLYNYKARIYSPYIGRFLQTDPIGYADGLNWYAYVGNDPMNRGDPTGTQVVSQSYYPDPATSPSPQSSKAFGEYIAQHPFDAAQIVGNLVSLIPTPVTEIGGGIVSGVGTVGKMLEGGTAVPVSPKGPDFVTTSGGVTLRPTTTGNRQSLEAAGHPGQPTTQTSETGTVHTVGQTDVRIMNGGSGGAPRVVTSRTGTNDPVQPNGAPFPNGTPRADRRDGSHIELGQ